MQNRYAGDVGDFGKFGMLRCMEQCGIRIGVNWYLVEDESHNQDGKHIGYLHNDKFDDLDDELHKALKSLIMNDSRSVNQLEELGLLQSNAYYHEMLKPVTGLFRESRSAWHEKGLKSLSDCELIFLDPDNGLLPRSIGRGSAKSIKYVLPEEIIDYYKAGHSVVFYSHRTREQLSTYLSRFEEVFDSKDIKGATITGISFRRGTVRDYFFILQEKHKDKIIRGIETLLRGGWRQHFEMIDMSTKSEWIEKTEAFLKEEFENSKYMSEHSSDREYRLQHSYRVANIGKMIAEKEGFDVTEMVIACLLHDVSYRDEFETQEDWVNHGRNSAQIARTFLEELGMDETRINDICYGIAIHVDDKADFDGERTAFAESVGDADNIDRFDAYRIYEGLQYCKFSEMPFGEKKEKVASTLERLQQYKDMQLGTKTATEIWRERILFYIEFYEKLRAQLENSTNV